MLVMPVGTTTDADSSKYIGQLCRNQWVRYSPTLCFNQHILHLLTKKASTLDCEPSHQIFPNVE